MHRLALISLLSVVALAIPATSWAASTSANLAINVTAVQSITGVSLSGSTFTGGAPSGTVVGAISVTMLPSSPTFSGSLSLSGTNASSFQIVGSNLETNGAVPAGTYNITIIATEAGLTGSPFTQAETVTGTDPPTGIEVPGPSQVLFNNPYYKCNQNFYVNGSTGKDNNVGSSSSPWATLQHAHDAISISGTGSWCVNVAPGIYSAGVLFTKGGNLASSTGYFVYRCQTIDACTVTANGAGGSNGTFAWNGTTTANYVVIDGFTISPAGANQFGQGIEIWDNDGDVGQTVHHVWLLNSIVTGAGQSGLQMNDGEYFFAVHNTIYSNSGQSNCGAQGSGISFAANKAFPSYTRTADDSNNPILGDIGSGFHSAIEWNVLYNNSLGANCTNGATDGNNIIMDTNSNYFNSFPNYTGGILIAFNITYNAGGKGVWIFDSTNVTVANNSCYNTNLDANISGTARPCLGTQGGNADLYTNNVVYEPVGSGVLANNNAFQLDNELDLNQTGTPVPDVASSNVSYCTGTPLNPCNAAYNGAVYSCSTNKCNTQPGWVNVGNTSAGSQATPPSGVNFALGSGSPAIGYGATKSYLSPQSVDAGACYHTLTSCP